jgi:hypothetical protein
MAAKIGDSDAGSIGGGTPIARRKPHDLNKVDLVDRRICATGSEPQIVIAVEPVGRGRFRSKVDGRVLVRSSGQPFVDSARALIGEGCDPAIMLVMRHRGSPIDALVAEVGAAAKSTVREDRGAPEFVPYHQMPRRLDAGPARVAQNDEPAVLTPSDAIDDPRRPHDASAGAR